MKMQIGKWGNSLAMRFPKDVVERYNLKEGDKIDIGAVEKLLADANDSLVQARKQAALEQIRKLRRPLPEDWKFDREESNWRPAMDRW